MTTSVTFENATLAEVVRRADSVTPKKGEAFDKAAGIVFDITPGTGWPVRVRATNLDVYYMEWVNALACEGEAITWRLGAAMLGRVVQKLPIGTGKTVTLTNIDSMLHITSGRFKSKIALIDPSLYPSWEPFNPGNTAPVADLGARLSQVAWSAAKSDDGSLTGIRFNGETVTATDRYRLAQVPCVAPHITREVVVPGTVIASLVKQMGDTNVGIVGEQLVFMPNEYTQIRTVILGGKYPPVERVMKQDHPCSIQINRAPFIEYMERVGTAGLKIRDPEMTVWIGEEEVAFYMRDGNGDDDAGDVMEIPGQAAHPRFTFYITPQNLIDALTAAPSERITLHYDPSDPLKIIWIDGGSGYNSWVVPRKHLAVSSPNPSEKES